MVLDFFVPFSLSLRVADVPRPARRQVWSTNGVEGVHRFLARAWRLFEGGLSDELPSREQLRLLHSTIKRVCPMSFF